LPFTFDVDANGLRTLPFGETVEIKDIPAFYCDGFTVDAMGVKKRLHSKTAAVDLAIELAFRVREQGNDKVVAFECTLLNGAQELLLGIRDGVKIDAGDSDDVSIHYWVPQETFAPYIAEGSNPRLRVSIIVRSVGSADATTFASSADAVLAAAAFAPAKSGADGHVNFFLGEQLLDDHYWGTLDEHGEIGVVMSFGRNNWPVHIAVDVLTSGDETSQYDGAVGFVTTTGSTFEIDAGPRKIWKKGSVLPYLGGGLGLIGGRLKTDDGLSSVKEKQATLGLWANTGVLFRIGTNFNIGVDLRWSKAPLGDLVPNFTIYPYRPPLTMGGVHLGVLMGFGW
jgi:hypothetical protein